MSNKSEKDLEARTAQAEEDAPADTTTLSISYSPSTGSLGIYGPLGDRPFCLYLLEMARIQIMTKPPAADIQSNILTRKQGLITS